MNYVLIRKIRNILKSNDELAWRLKLINMWFNRIKSYKDDDREFVIKQYKARTGLDLNLDTPRTYNEKINWMKLYYRNPLLHRCVDKYEVRSYVKDKLGDDKILIPIYGVYENIDEIDFNQLPDSFVLKLTNGSSFNFVCYEKNKRDIHKMKVRFKKWIKQDYYTYGREWAYKGVPNRIISEELLKPQNGNPPEDYRFFCFSGKVKVISVDIDSVVNGVKQSSYFRNLYDAQWNRIEARIEWPNKECEIPAPEKLDEMIAIAEKLSEDFPAVRVDLYYFDNNIYFGELTFYHSSGYQSLYPEDFALQMGEWINLKNINC